MAKLTDRIGSFTAVPDIFIKNSTSLSDHSRWLFICLRHYTNNRTDTAFPSYNELQSLTGYGRTTIANALKDLIATGWVDRKRRFSESTLYTTRIPEWLSSPAVETNAKLTISPAMETAISPAMETNAKLTISLAVETAISPVCGDTNQTIELDKEVRGATAPRLARNPDPFFDKLADITQTSPKLQGAMIGKTKSKLLKDEATLQELDCFKAYWYSQDWRGKKGEVPSLPQVVSEWTKAKTWEGNSQSAGASTNNGEWEWATIPTGIVLRHKGGTFPSLRGEEAKLKAREIGLEVIF